MEKDSFILYKGQFSNLSLLTMEERGELLTAIICHVNNETPPPLSNIATVFLQPIKEQIDRDSKKYQEICETRAANGEIGKKYGYLGAEFGKLGGRPCKTYEEIIGGYTFSDIVKKKVWSMIQAQQLKHEPFKNAKLRNILDKVAKVDEVRQLSLIDKIMSLPNNLNE